MQSEIFKPKILCRERICKMLSQIFETSVLFISAPIGYGKTTMVKEFLKKNSEVKNIWFSMELVEDDKIIIWEMICEEICKVNNELGKGLRKLGFPHEDKDFKEIISLIIKQKSYGKTVLVIDDYGQAFDLYFQGILKRIMMESIPDIHVVVISRENLEEEYIELELKQKCIMISQDDIKFTIEETIKFFEENKFKLSNEEFEKIYTYTLGWIAATYFILISYEKNHQIDDVSKAKEIIKCIMYKKLDENARVILLKLAPIKEFAVKDIIDITNMKEAGEVILKMKKDNGFIQYNYESKKYYFHPILREVLLSELLNEYSDSKNIYDDCARWYLSNSRHMDAVNCYHKNRNFNSILKIFENIKLSEYINESPKLIQKLFDDIPLDIRLKNPKAYISLIYFYILNIDFEKGKKILHKTKEYYEQDNKLKDKSSIIDKITLIECCISFEDININIENFIESCISLSKSNPNILNDEVSFILGTPNLIYLYHKKQGYLNKNREKVIRSVTNIKQLISNFEHGLEYLIKGEYCFETNKLEDAKIFAYKALHKAKINNSSNIIICAYFLIMRLDLCFNKIDELNRHLHELKYEEKKFISKINLGQALMAKSYIYGIMNDYDNMDKYIRKYEKLNLQQLPQVKSANYVLNAIKCIINQDFIKLEIYVEELNILNAQYKNIFINIYAYIFDSIVKNKLYKNYRMAEESLINAINLSKCDNIVMPFVEFYQYILTTMKEIKNTDEYISFLINECEKRKELYDKNLKEENEVIKLTARELDVMRLVEEGYSQNEISERLHIALTTVKKHTSSVYSKINAKNKTIAIRILKDKKII